MIAPIATSVAHHPATPVQFSETTAEPNVVASEPKYHKNRKLSKWIECTDGLPEVVDHVLQQNESNNTIDEPKVVASEQKYHKNRKLSKWMEE